MALLCQGTRGSGSLSCFHWVLPLSLPLSPLPHYANIVSTLNTTLTLPLVLECSIDLLVCRMPVYVGRFMRCADFPKLFPVYSPRAMSSVLQGSADGYSQGYSHIIYFIDFFLWYFPFPSFCLIHFLMWLLFLFLMDETLLYWFGCFFFS